MSQVKHFLVFIVTPAIPHGTFKMEVTFCVKAVYTTAIANFQKALRADPGNGKALAGLEGARKAKQTEDQVLKPH